MILGSNYNFIAVPKTGSATVGLTIEENDPSAIVHNPFFSEKVVPEFNEFWNAHVPASMLFDKMPDRKKEYTFGFVRNPFDRFVSFCAWRKFNIKDKRDSSLLTFENNPKMYMRVIAEREPIIRDITTIVWNQCHFVDHPNVDFVGRFENLQDDFDMVCDVIDMPRTALRKFNWSNRHPDYRTYYDTSLVDKVTELYKEDLIKFGYKFE